MAFKSSSRNGARVLWVCVHTAEGATRATNLRAYFERPDINASSHAIADDAILLDHLVPYDRAAWTLRNGNEESDNLELCGFAAWSREEWLTRHMGMVRHAAAWIRSRCLARGIPIVKLSPADVRAGKSGVIGHVDYTNGTGDGTHWDPGPGFPWDVVMQLASGGKGEMELSDKVKLWDNTEVTVGQLLVGLFGRIAPLYENLVEPHNSLVGGSTYEAPTQTYVRQVDARTFKMADQVARIDEIEAKVDGLIAGLNGLVTKVNTLLERTEPDAE
jgi:hypothetical protein